MRHCRWILLSALLAACGQHAAPPPPTAAQAPSPAPPAPAPQAPPPAATTPATLSGGERVDAFFDRSKYPNAIEGHFVDPASLTATEKKWGMSPKPDPRIKYQDDVLLMEHGDQAIRGGGTDAITFQFDAQAEHVGEFKEGIVVFATGRVVGRIAQLKREGATVTVKLTPVQITEVIKEGQFIINAPVDVSQMIVRTAPDLPGAIDSSLDAPQAQNLRDERPALLPAQFLRTQLPSQLGKNLVPPPLTIPPFEPASAINLTDADFQSGSIRDLGSKTVGVSYVYKKNGVDVHASGELMLGTPTIKCVLIFSSKGVDTFGFDISGSLGLRLAVKATSDQERFVNAKLLAAPPFDVSLPLPIGGVPLELSFSTAFYLRTGFSAKTSLLQAAGVYSLEGHMFAGWQHGGPSFDYPTVKAKSRLVENVAGVSMGINSLGGTFRVTPMIGIGAFGFKSGVYLGVNFSGNGIKQSSAALDCRGADLTGTIDSGIGYQLNSGIIGLINKVLKAFTIYQIPTSGTLIKGPGGEFMKIDEDIPTNCAGLSNQVKDATPNAGGGSGASGNAPGAGGPPGAAGSSSGDASGGAPGGAPGGGCGTNDPISAACKPPKQGSNALPGNAWPT